MARKRALGGVAVFLAAVALAGVGAGATVQAASATTGTFVFSTASAQLYPPGNNSGWWGEAGAFGSANTNDNYYVGWSGASRYNDYFTFDISSLTNPCVPASAYLTVPRGGGGGGASSVVYYLHDVTSSPIALATKANGPSQSIYNDLGGGGLYGSYSLPTATGPAFTLNLNSTALNDLYTAKHLGASYFSVGGSLEGAPSGQYLLHSSEGNAVTLTVTYSKICKVYP
jgi:hypothetical protein